MVVTIVRRQVAKAIENKIFNLLIEGDEKLTNYLYQHRPVKTPVIRQESTTSSTDTARFTTTTTTTMQQRPGIISSLVVMLNKNIKTSVAKKMKRGRAPSSSTGKMAPTKRVEEHASPSPKSSFKEKKRPYNSNLSVIYSKYK